MNLLSLRREKGPLSCRLCDGVGVVSPAQVLADVDPKEREAADSLYCRSVDGDGGVSYSLSLPVVHRRLLRFADVEMEVVVLAPRCQDSDLLSVCRLVAVCDQADNGCVVSKLCDGVGALCGHAVMGEQGVEERAEHAALGCAGVESQGG